ncbi:MAG: hypothetical protein JXA71_11250, partial [Chitinispirillaceae bacterium]|nr:hypothetical protein [Chitinispirillaceae bacterium]
MHNAVVRSPEFWIILAVWIIVYGVLGTPFPVDYDSVNFALAIADTFDPARHQPQPPGYFFHVMFGAALHLVVDNPIRVLQLQNIAYLAVALVVLCRLPAVPMARLFLCTLPLLLFFTGAPVIFAALIGFSALIGYQAFVLIERKGDPVLLAGTYALAIGFRQDLSLFLLPIVAYALWIRRPAIRQVALMGAVFTAITATWFIPTWLASSRL